MTIRRSPDVPSHHTLTSIVRRACSAAWLSLVAACAPAHPSRAELEPPVYVAVLESMCAVDTTSRLVGLLGRDTMPRLIVVDRMGADPVRWLATFAPEPHADSAAAARWVLERRTIPPDLAEDFIAANLRPDSLHVPLAARPPVYFASLPPMTAAEEGALFAWRPGDPLRGYGRRAYPKPDQLLRLSRAGFSPDRRHALVYVESYCGPLCAGGTLVRLSRDGERWRVMERLPLWAS